MKKQKSVFLLLLWPSIHDSHISEKMFNTEYSQWLEGESEPWWTASQSWDLNHLQIWVSNLSASLLCKRWTSAQSWWLLCTNSIEMRYSIKILNHNEEMLETIL